MYSGSDVDHTGQAYTLLKNRQGTAPVCFLVLHRLKDTWSHSKMQKALGMISHHTMIWVSQQIMKDT